MLSLVKLHLFLHSFIHSFIYCLIHPFYHFFIHLTIPSFIAQIYRAFFKRGFSSIPTQTQSSRSFGATWQKLHFQKKRRGYKIWEDTHPLQISPLCTIFTDICHGTNSWQILLARVSWIVQWTIPCINEPYPPFAKKSANYLLTGFWSSEWHDNLELHSVFGDVFISIPNDPLFETMPYFVIKKLKKWLSVHDFSREAFLAQWFAKNRYQNLSTILWRQRRRAPSARTPK